jgi:hypothetical protein
MLHLTQMTTYTNLKIWALLTCTLLALNNSNAYSEEMSKDSSKNSGVVVKVEKAVEHGAKATARGIEHGVKAAARGIDHGVKAAGKGIDRGVNAVTGGIKHDEKTSANTAGSEVKK